MGWDVCGRVAWIGFILSYALLLRVSGLFFKDNGRVYTVYCFRRQGVVVHTSERLLVGEGSLEVDAVEVYF